MKELKGILISNDDNLLHRLNEAGFNIINAGKAFHMSMALKSNKNADYVIYDDNFLGVKNSAPYMISFINSIINTSKKPLIILSDEQISDISKYSKMKVDDILEREVPAETLEKRILFLHKHSEEIKSNLDVNDRVALRVPAMKRIFDITVALSALLILSPLLLVVIVLIKLESRGPVFYSSKRVGMGYKVFGFYKFRSMYKDADKRLKDLKLENQYAQSNEQEFELSDYNGLKKTEDSKLLFADDGFVDENAYLKYTEKEKDTAFIKIKNDPRITKVGRFIRNTSIDELPQLINVLKGDMSIVGNRPLPLYEAECLTSDEWVERFNAPAGLTGLWQVEKRARSSEMSPEERKQLDVEYARNYSLIKDIKLILRTIPALLQSENV